MICLSSACYMLPFDIYICLVIGLFPTVGRTVQANGRDVLGSNCSVGLATSMPALHEGIGHENVSDQPEVEGQSATSRAADVGVVVPQIRQDIVAD